MPYPSIDLLTAAVSELTGRHPLTIITVPAILRAAREAHVAPTVLQPFGSAQERVVLEAFKINNTKKPYIAVWGYPPQLVNHDYAGSTLQRLRTQDILGRSILHDDFDPKTRRRKRFGLRADAGRTLAASQPRVSKAAIASWLGRRQQVQDLRELMSWFDETYPLGRTDLHMFYTDDIPDRFAGITHLFDEQPVDDGVIAALLDVTVAAPMGPVWAPAGSVESKQPEDEGMSWTREICQFTLGDADPRAISDRVLADLHARHIILPDERQLVRRCVTALLVGHVILQGPPGTGKTTLARALAHGFGCHLIESTATSDWSPYHVVGGLRPSITGGLTPAYGSVTEAARRCAEIVRAAANAAENQPDAPTLSFEQAEAPVNIHAAGNGYQAAWLLIDEFNRADIDKAIGSLYTLLSSCDPEHLATTPIDLWFETREDNRRLWVPARFRIIGAMNDLDTSFVSRISQGLTRRFQFVTVGVSTARATEGTPVTLEVATAFAGAYAWLDRTYGGILAVRPMEESRSALASQIEAIQAVMDGLRAPSGNIVGWPVGTAQVVDVLRTLLLWTSADPDSNAAEVLDFAVADRLVPQMSGIDDTQYESFIALFNRLGLTGASGALEHILDPHTLR